MQKKITYTVLLFVGIVIGFKACDFLNRANYRIEVQKFRDTKTVACGIIQKDKELEITTACNEIN